MRFEGTRTEYLRDLRTGERLEGRRRLLCHPLPGRQDAPSDNAAGGVHWQESLSQVMGVECIFKMLSRIEAGPDAIRRILTLMLFSSLFPRRRQVMSAQFTNMKMR